MARGKNHNCANHPSRLTRTRFHPSEYLDFKMVLEILFYSKYSPHESDFNTCEQLFMIITASFTLFSIATIHPIDRELAWYQRFQANKTIKNVTIPLTSIAISLLCRDLVVVDKVRIRQCPLVNLQSRTFDDTV